MISRKLLHAFSSSYNAIKYLLNRKIIAPFILCKKCRRRCFIDERTGIYRCKNTPCRLRNTFSQTGLFNRSRTRMHKLLLIFWLYIFKMPVTGIITGVKLSSGSVCKWTKRVRRMCAEKICREERNIGGKEVIVEVDETKMGKRKYNRGHRVEGVWVIVGIERREGKAFFAVDVEKRDYETIKVIFQKYIHPESIVYTDGWKTYPKVCEELGLRHRIVNHSKWFKDPETGVHTNTVEGQNNGLKMGIPARNRNKKNISGFLHYLVWKKQNIGDLWSGFLSVLSEHLK